MGRVGCSVIIQSVASPIVSFSSSIVICVLPVSSIVRFVVDISVVVVVDNISVQVRSKEAENDGQVKEISAKQVSHGSHSSSFSQLVQILSKNHSFDSILCPSMN